MSERPVIEARALTKIYKLYDNPKQKFRDMIGLLRDSSGIPVHHALDHVDLTVRAGERVGIIGRNGAGKSTLLKLISGVLEPTSGILHIEGSARALLEIGTGFHPDFTGRENVRAYLAQLGISGERALELLDEIVEFAELEEYIGQPLKTYSTGMAVRLMFATSTAVAPELLILDEVLGVGDAYFTRKSFDRIEQMCNRDGATLLLVSHDIYTSAKLCERMIWLERGRVVFDGEPADAIKAYEESIREQEEQRLRAKSAAALARSGSFATAGEVLTLELASATGAPQVVPVDIARLGITLRGGTTDELPVTVPEAEWVGGRLNFAEGCWGPIEHDGDDFWRSMQTFGSPFHKVGGTLAAPTTVDALDSEDVAVVVRARAEQPVDLVARVFAGGRQVGAVRVPPLEASWTEISVPLSSGQEAVGSDFSSGGLYGTGRVRVESARVLGADGQPTAVLWHGMPAAFEFDVRVMDPDLNERSDVIVGVLRDGVDTACRFFTRDVAFNGRQPEVCLKLDVDALRLGSGSYSVALLIGRRGYADDESQQFYSYNPGLHVSVHEVVDFTVKAVGIVPKGTPWVGDGTWSSAPRTA